MKILIKPQETFFFRDARPFDKGEGWASGIFPPLPSTVYGAFRTAAISQKSTIAEYYDTAKKISIRTEMGSPITYGSFCIRSLLLHNRYGCLVPMPLDLLEDENNNLYALIPNNRKIISDLSFDFYMSLNPGFEEPKVSWLDCYGIKDYLFGKSKIDIRKSEKLLIEEEIKTGIEKNPNKGSAEEHMLYVQKMLRLNDSYEFSVDADNISSVDTEGILKIGHDGRMFSYRITDGGNFNSLNSSKDYIINEIEKNKKFKILFTSPAILENGWAPRGVEKPDYIWQPTDSLKIKIKSAVLGKPMRVGGWDMKTKQPKLMRKAVSPGSVYYCELVKGTVSELFDALFDKNISDADDNLAKQRFGHILIGAMSR